MSVVAVKLAFQQDLPGQSSVKFLLVALAQLHHHEDESWEVYAAIDYLASATNLNRKTVIKGLETLRQLGYITDTGKLAGRNRCIPIYRLRFPAGAASPRDNAGTTFHNVQITAPTQSAAMTQMPQSAAINSPASQHEPPPSHAAQPISKSWFLPPEWRDWARRHKPHWDDSRIDTVATIFHVHWMSIPGPKGLRPDWFSEWCKWVLRERDEPPPSQTLEPHPLAQEPYLADVDLSTDDLDYAVIGADIRRAMEELGTDDIVDAMGKIKMLGNRAARRAARKVLRTKT